jgi:sugar transferase (PEP-CTERM system associated)
MIDAIVEAIPDKRRQVEVQRVSLRTLNGQRQVLILGRGKFAKVCWETLYLDRAFSRRVIGFVESKIDCMEECVNDPGIVGTFDELPELVERYKVGMIVVCLDDHRSALPIQMLLDLKVAGIEVIDGHRLFEKVTGRLSIDSLRPSALIFSTGFKRHRMTMIVKRAFDVFLAGLSLLVMAPLLLLVACLITLDSSGPVFYRQLRVGLNAQPFMMLKFRSMSNDAEVNGPCWAETKDPRVSRVGQWMRKWRIDEIPQFMNVLKGEMSIVGPRPERPVFVQELSKTIPYYDIRHTVRPGITGWAQVMFRYASSEEDSHRKLQYDLYYVKNLSAWLDIKTLFKTIRVLIKGEGAR